MFVTHPDELVAKALRTGSPKRPSHCVRPSVMRRVLVVDDDDTIRQLVATCLEDEGWRVATAANGAQALSQMRAATYDIVLLDLMMPVLDGWSVLDQRRADLDLKAVPVVVMSAGGRIALDRAQLLGADGCIAKPFELDEVIALLERVRRRGPKLSEIERSGHLSFTMAGDQLDVI